MASLNYSTYSVVDIFNSWQGLHDAHMNKAKELRQSNGLTGSAVFHYAVALFESIPVIAHLVSIIELACGKIFSKISQCSSNANGCEASLKSPRVSTVFDEQEATSVSAAVKLQTTSTQNTVKESVDVIKNIASMYQWHDNPASIEKAKQIQGLDRNRLYELLKCASLDVKLEIANELIQDGLLLGHLNICVRNNDFPFLLEALKMKVDESIKKDKETLASLNRGNYGYLVCQPGSNQLVRPEDTTEHGEALENIQNRLDNLSVLVGSLNFNLINRN